LVSEIFSNKSKVMAFEGRHPRRSKIVKKVKQSLYTPWRRLGGEEV
jgi:hypothetical protein